VRRDDRSRRVVAQDEVAAKRVVIRVAEVRLNCFEVGADDKLRAPELEEGLTLFIGVHKRELVGDRAERLQPQVLRKVEDKALAVAARAVPILVLRPSARAVPANDQILFGVFIFDLVNDQIGHLCFLLLVFEVLNQVVRRREVVRLVFEVQARLREQSLRLLFCQVFRQIKEQQEGLDALQDLGSLKHILQQGGLLLGPIEVELAMEGAEDRTFKNPPCNLIFFAVRCLLKLLLNLGLQLLQFNQLLLNRDHLDLRLLHPIAFPLHLLRLHLYSDMFFNTHFGFVEQLLFKINFLAAAVTAHLKGQLS
jgi:hypothetical protein